MEAGIDPCGIRYDSAWTSPSGTVHYARRPGGNPPGGSHWTSEHDCNPVCGCHLVNKCDGCQVCVSCDGCYCNEGEY